MEHTAWLVLASVLGVSLVSLAGVLVLPLGSRRLVYLVSFSAGALFGDAFLHLFPEALENGAQTAGWFALAGIVLFFVVEQFIRWHHCHGSCPEDRPHPFGYMNLVGDAVHNFIDGVLIAGAFLVSVPLGLATALAVALHEIPQEISDFGVLLQAGFSRGKALLFNFLSALTALLGAGAALAWNAYAGNVAAALVPLAAGGFVYIAGADLIPEVHRQGAGTRQAALHLAAFVLGIATMAALLLLE